MVHKVSIIIVHWNTPDKLITLLRLLKKSDDYQIIVVDNASIRNLNWLKKDFPFVELIENKFNRGYSFACNQGVTHAEGEWLLFLNPDMEINSSQIEEILDHSKKNNLAVCSVKTNESYEKPLPSVLSLLAEFTPINRLIGVNNFRPKTIFGGCFLIRTDVLNSISGWDERFFLWFEDSDLTYRLIQNNFKIGWLDLPIKHSGGESFKKLGTKLKKDIFFQSMEIYARKHFSPVGKLVISLLKKKYTNRKLLPDLQNITSITIPNLKADLLTSFFQDNEKYLNSTPGVEWTVVTSSIKGTEIWEWRKKYPKVRFISIIKNYGFASTVNIGFRASSGRWLGTINDDVVLNKDWLNNLLTCADKSTGSINPTIKNDKGHIESAGIKVLLKGKAVTLKLEDLNMVYLDNGRVKNVPTCLNVDATNAAAVIYSKEALDKVGIFDEKFGSYLEDVDLSLRLNRAGYKNMVSLNSEVAHLGQSTSKDLHWRKQYLDFKNWILVILKNWSVKELVLNFPVIFLERIRNLFGILKSL